jgi:peptidoglycan/xylan/chitin deacetylase (PgdA/CDA1 family)
VRPLFLFIIIAKIASVLTWQYSATWALTLWFTPDFVLAYHVFVPYSQGLIHSPLRFKPTGRHVWLTIDDGPDPTDTPRILALLKTHDAKATFFVIGRNVLAYPAEARAILEAGHQLAHHTQTHPLSTIWFAGPRRLGRELDQGIAAIKSIGVTPTRFRPPAGLRNLWLATALRRRNLVCVGWSRRGLEILQSEPAAVATRVTKNISPGDILLMHEGPAVPPTIRVEAIKLTLERLRAAGFRCVIPAPEQLS